MKKVLSLIMSFVMFVSITAGLNITVNAKDYASDSTELSLDGQWSDNYWITETNKVHWYRITIPSDGHLELRLRSYHYYTQLALFTYDLSTTIIDDHYFYASGSDNSPETVSSGVALSTGTYYAKVSGYTGRYNLYASYESYGVNDTESKSFDSPQDLPQNHEIVGASTATNKDDWFKIHVTKDNRYSFKLTSYHYYTELNLYNYDLSKLLIDGQYFRASGSDNSPETKTGDIALSPGTYYIKINSNEYGKYHLSWQELTPANCKHDYDGNLKYCRLCGAKNPAYASPKGTKIKKVSGTKKSVAVTWTKVSGVYGYQVQVATDKKFKNKKTVTISMQNATKTTVKKLKAKKKYYIRVRTYKVVNGQRIYSSWTSAKKAKTK